MSIAVLKRKTQAKYNNMSVGQSQFSLQGTHRNQGWVGQSNLSRSFPGTLFRGTAPRGSGGCCGTFDTHTNVQSLLVGPNLNDSSVVKSSVLNTKGMIQTKYRWIQRPAPFVSVKPDSNQNNNTQESYIKYIRKKAIQNTVDCNGGSSVKKDVVAKCIQCNDNEIKQYFKVGYTNDFSRNSRGITKPASDYVATTQSERLVSLSSKCTALDPFTVPNTNLGRTPFACSNVVSL
jgi:hypothetical protein